MRHVIIGDVHGCLAELQALVERVDPQPGDHVIFVGDLQDKGPDSPGVIRFCRELQRRCKVILIDSNHGDLHSRYRRHLRDNPALAAQMCAGETELDRIARALSAEDVEFLDQAILYHEIPEHRALVVHAGVPPSVRRLPEGRRRSEMSSKDWKYFSQLLRTRFVSPAGNMVALGQEKPEDAYWADVYDGRFGVVYYGHQPYVDADAPVRNHDKTAIGVDLGCVFGNRLCAVVLSSGGQQVMTVNAREKYAVTYWEAPN
jgi:serine/threonine protein phosphatase 1